MTTDNSVNYTDEQTTKAVDEYLSGVAVETIAVELGKTVRSVIAKLTREKVYVSKASVNKHTRVTKAMLISTIAVKFHLELSELESLEKATHSTLELLAGVPEVG